MFTHDLSGIKRELEKYKSCLLSHLSTPGQCLCQIVGVGNLQKLSYAAHPVLTSERHCDPLSSKLHPSGNLWCLRQALWIISRAVFDLSLCCSRVAALYLSLVVRGEIRNTIGGQDSLCHSHLWNICSISLAFSLIAGLEGDGKALVVESRLWAVLTCSPMMCDHEGKMLV